MSTRTLIFLVVIFLVLAGAIFFVSRQDRSEPANEFTPSDLDVSGTKDTTGTNRTNPTEDNGELAQKACVTGGCSGQMCGEEGSEMISTCEFRLEYSCLKQYAVCERQTTGKCGWTQTETYNQCMIEISEK